MAKAKVTFICSNCEYRSPKWLGVCPSCNEWHTFEEKVEEKKTQQKNKADISRESGSDEAVPLTSVEESEHSRQPTGIEELDRVLGGGIVAGSFMLLGGDPGIGKSTLMLQLAKARPDWPILYVAGEESPSQIKQRAERLGVTGDKLYIYSSSNIDSIIAQTRKLKPALLVIDSIQTVYSSNLTSLPGSVQQVRECSAMLQQLAKREGFSTMMIGHVTKDGEIAGPKILEHMVDTVLYFEGNQSQFHRLLRSVKNRFGPAQEVGVFEMKQDGLAEVPNPSELFLSDLDTTISGNCITCVMEGSRPILIEVQALVTASNYSTPQRTANGFDQRRLSLLIAVLEKRGGISFAGQDVYLNIAGGLKISDPAADLAVIAALSSSIKDHPIRKNAVFIGEVGLGGEIRSVRFREQRIREAEKMGIKSVVAPPGQVSVQSNIELVERAYISQIDK
ncbi:DNA repair protein RadA [Rhodohalobacter sp. SW132]|uniref:DNA repair protein RadA n=1 Tax=Rhodohalobacter sp. SW132 TaxID=2293433 RepID=UPI000E261FEE|nr:DNA repair protein RadA [Rhodohalobacter sp. SW132]REL33192.1 DNA repair protein RadA [Rhodohalobacter sp. SW132]